MPSLAMGFGLHKKRFIKSKGVSPSDGKVLTINNKVININGKTITI